MSGDEEYATPTELGPISDEELPLEPGVIEDHGLGVECNADPEPPVEDNSSADVEINDDEDEEDDDE
jgi:hypothetical protein